MRSKLLKKRVMKRQSVTVKRSQVRRASGSLPLQAGHSIGGARSRFRRATSRLARVPVNGSWLALLVLVNFALCNAAFAADKPNILFIAADDLRPQLNCYGRSKDPQENVNIAIRPENVEVVKQLTAQLAAGWPAAVPTSKQNQKDSK